jgi:hypothetical protein
MKNLSDWALAMGINDFIIHTYQHQPLGVDGPKPGMAMGQYGIHWQRNQTFWPMVGPYHDYLARCGQMLRQGVSVADILYLTPEGAPNIFMPPEDAMLGKDVLREKKNYGFDAVSASILLERARVEEGRIVFPEASSYRVLVLPLWETMTPALLTKLAQLVHDGATVIGVPPRKSPSLSDYPRCDAQVRTAAIKLWGGDKVPAATAVRAYGRGRIIWGGELTPVTGGAMYPSYEATIALLRRERVAPVFESTGSLRHHQRRTEAQDIFFVANREARDLEAFGTFRTDGGAPEWWDPVTGARRLLPEFQVSGDTVKVPLRLAAFGSGFVVFNRQAVRQSATLVGANFPAEKILGTLEGPCSVTFDPSWGGPKEPVAFATLIPWNSHSDEGIRYYSGAAVYRKIFDVAPPVAGRSPLFLDLGVVHKLARVKLNGEDLGIVWTPPFRVEITGKLRPKGNVLELTVVNTWVNRLVGDQQPANKDVRQLKWDSGLLLGKAQPAGRYTFTTVKNDYQANSPLQESGLIGPLRLLTLE